jgi:phage baseplate assembly protein W
MSTYNKTILGSAVTFPLEIDSNGRVVVHSDEEMIRRSITTILTWPHGTRYFLGEFGSLLEALLEDPNDKILVGLVKHYIIDAISKWEARISALEIPEIKQEDNRLDILLSYRITALAKEDSFVFPYYKEIKY